MNLSSPTFPIRQRSVAHPFTRTDLKLSCSVVSTVHFPRHLAKLNWYQAKVSDLFAHLGCKLFGTKWQPHRLVLPHVHNCPLCRPLVPPGSCDFSVLYALNTHASYFTLLAPLSSNCAPQPLPWNEVLLIEKCTSSNLSKTFTQSQWTHFLPKAFSSVCDLSAASSPKNTCFVSSLLFAPSNMFPPEGLDQWRYLSRCTYVVPCVWRYAYVHFGG